MEILLQDLRYAFRRQLKDRRFSVVALLALMFGIGANTAIFSVVNSILIRPLPYKDPESLIMIWGKNTQLDRHWMTFSTGDFMDYKDQNEVFEQISAVERTDFNLTGTGEPERIQGTRVTTNLFPMLGISPQRGRYFSEDEGQPGQGQVVMLSHGLWQRRFGSDPNLIGRTLTLNNQSYDVIGVLPPGFQLPTFPPNFPVPSLEPELWIPLALDQNRLSRTGNSLFLMGRLKPGIDINQAQASMSGIAKRLEQQFLQSNTGAEVFLIALPEQAIGDMKRSLLLLLGAVGFVLLIACSNIANLLLARATTRRTEMAIRAALGASRKRIIRQMLTESTVLAFSGGVLGLLFAYLATQIIIAISPSSLPRANEVRLDGWVLGFTLLISFLTGIVVGIFPALQASKLDLNDSLKEGGRGSMSGSKSRRLHSLLVVSEIAFALTLLIGSGLMVKSLMRLASMDTGYNVDNLLAFQITLPRSKYTGPSQKAFYEQIIQQTEGLPGVRSAAAINILPLTGADAGTFITIEGAPVPDPRSVISVSFRSISQSYFRTMGIALVNGRDFTSEDAATFRIIINETLAKRYFPDQDPVGRRIKLGRPESPGSFLPIVGVVSDVRQIGLLDDEKPTLYLPFLQQPSMNVIARTATNPMNFVAAIRSTVLNMDSELPIHNIRTMEQRFADQVARPKFRTVLLTTFAALALLLAVLGIYGVMAYTVTQRTHEIGIRMALGARSRDIIKMVLMQGIILTALGVAIGMALAVALTRVLGALLYEVSTTDVTIFVVCPLILIAVALLANYLPARRATRVEPMKALRYE